LPHNGVRFDDRFGDYVFVLREGSSHNVAQQLFWCPWCGAQLPESHRDQWFAELEALGLDPWSDPIPDRYNTAAWRAKGDEKG